MDTKVANVNIDKNEAINYLNDDFSQVEAELVSVDEKLDREQILRVEIDEGLKNEMQALQELKSQLPKEQAKSLLKLCGDNVIETIESQFGLLPILLDAKDGGNVNTTHNARQGIYANDKERQRYENRGEYDSRSYHTDKAYKDINKAQSELKKQRELKDYMTGERLAPNADTDLDHIVSAKEIHDDPARVLAEMSGEELANTTSNLRMTNASLNRSKKDKSADDFLRHRDERLQKLAHNKQKRGFLLDSEKNELEKLQKQLKINDEELKKIYEEEKKKNDKSVDKAYYTSSKPYKELLTTGGKDAAMMGLHTALGIVLRDFSIALMQELSATMDNWGKENIKTIFRRFKDRFMQTIEEIKAKWKHIFSNSIEAAITSFLSNIVVFVVNIFASTLKRIVRIIRAGFASLCKAIKMLVNPPKDMPKEDVAYEALKVLVAGLIGAVSLSLIEVIAEILEKIPVLTAIFNLPIPILGGTIGEAISITLSAVAGGCANDYRALLYG